MMYTLMNRPEMMMNRMIRNFYHHQSMGFPVDVKKTGNACILTAELPGVKLEDIAITVEDDMLTIAAEMNRPACEEQESYIIHERCGGNLRPLSVKRSFSLEGIDQNAITASCADGLLTITLPREAPAEGKGPRRIAITGSAPAIEAPAVSA